MAGRWRRVTRDLFARFLPAVRWVARAVGEGRRQRAGGFVDRRTVIAGIAAVPLAATTAVSTASSASASVPVADFCGHPRRPTLVIGHRGSAAARHEVPRASGPRHVSAGAEGADQGRYSI